MGILIDSVYWELGLKADQLKAEAAAVEQADDRIAASAQRAEDALTALVEEMLQTADGAAGVQRFIEQLSAATDEVTAGMSRAAAGSAKFDQGLRRLEQQQAEAAIRAAELARPVDAVAARMGFAASGTAKWEEGLRRLRVQQQEQAVQAGAFVAATDGSAKGANKVQNALVGLALQGTETGGSVGKLIEGLLLFGAGSAVVTGVAAGVAVIALAYRKITEEARKTKEAADQAREAIRTSLQTPRGDLLAQLDQLTQRIQALQQLREQEVVTTLESGETLRTQRGLSPAELNELNDLLAKRGLAQRDLEALRTADRREADALTNDLKQQASLLEQAIALRQRVGLDTVQLQRDLADTQRILAAVEAVPEAERANVRSQLEAQIGARQQALEQIRQELTARFTAVLPATVDATAEAIHKLSVALIAAGATPRELAASLDPLLTQLAALKEQADALERSRALSLGPEQALEALDRLRAEAVAQLSPTQTTANDLRLLQRIAQLDEDRARVAAQLVEANRQLEDLTGQVSDNTGEAAGAGTRLRATTAQIVQQVADIARGAIGVAQAFGLASDNTAAMLQNVITVADTLPDLLAQVDKIGKADPETGKSTFDASAFAASVTGVLGGLAGLAAGVLGESPAARRARELSEDNIAAIRELSENLGNLNLSIRGRDFAAGERGVEALLRAGLERLTNGEVLSGGRVDRGTADRILRGQGSSLRELQELARGLGVTLDTSNTLRFIRSLEQLQAAIAATEIAQFAETFAGQMQALNDEFALFDITDPLEQLEKLQELSQQTDRNGDLLGSPAIAEVLKDLDLTTQAGRDEAEKRLQELLRQARAGELTAEDLGLSLEEFRDLLKQIEGLIDDVNKDRGTQTGGGPVQETFGEFRGLTEETGSVIGGRLLSLDIHVLEGVGYQREMRDILARVFTATGPVPVPVLPATATAPGGLTVVIEQLVLPTTTDPSPAGLQTAGAAVGAGLLESLDQQLGSRYRLKQLLIGQTRVT